jgi:hypothetical protein
MPNPVFHLTLHILPTVIPIGPAAKRADRHVFMGYSSALYWSLTEAGDEILTVDTLRELLRAVTLPFRWKDHATKVCIAWRNAAGDLVISKTTGAMKDEPHRRMPDLDAGTVAGVRDRIAKCFDQAEWLKDTRWNATHLTIDDDAEYASAVDQAGKSAGGTADFPKLHVALAQLLREPNSLPAELKLAYRFRLPESVSFDDDGTQMNQSLDDPTLSSFAIVAMPSAQINLTAFNAGQVSFAPPEITTSLLKLDDATVVQNDENGIPADLIRDGNKPTKTIHIPITTPSVRVDVQFTVLYHIQPCHLVRLVTRDLAASEDLLAASDDLKAREAGVTKEEDSFWFDLKGAGAYSPQPNIQREELLANRALTIASAIGAAPTGKAPAGRPLEPTPPDTPNFLLFAQRGLSAALFDVVRFWSDGATTLRDSSLRANLVAYCESLKLYLKGSDVPLSADILRELAEPQTDATKKRWRAILIAQLLSAEKQNDAPAVFGSLGTGIDLLMNLASTDVDLNNDNEAKRRPDISHQEWKKKLGERVAELFPAEPEKQDYAITACRDISFAMSDHRRAVWLPLGIAVAHILNGSDPPSQEQRIFTKKLVDKLLNEREILQHFLETGNAEHPKKVKSGPQFFSPAANRQYFLDRARRMERSHATTPDHAALSSQLDWDRPPVEAQILGPVVSRGDLSDDNLQWLGQGLQRVIKSISKGPEAGRPDPLPRGISVRLAGFVADHTSRAKDKDWRRRHAGHGLLLRRVNPDDPNGSVNPDDPNGSANRAFAWRLLNAAHARTNVADASHTVSDPNQVPVVVALTETLEAGVRTIRLNYNDAPIVGVNPLARAYQAFGHTMQGDSIDGILSSIKYVPSTARDGVGYALPHLVFGGKYLAAAYTIDLAGGLPKSLTSDEPSSGKPWNHNHDVTQAGNLHVSDEYTHPIDYKREVPVGNARFRLVLPTDSRVTKEWPEFPGIYPLATEVYDHATQGPEDVPSPKAPPLLMLAEKEERDKLHLPGLEENLILEFRPPSIAPESIPQHFEIKDPRFQHWIGGDNNKDGVFANILAGRAKNEELEKKAFDSHVDVTVNDPEVAGLLLTIQEFNWDSGKFEDTPAKLHVTFCGHNEDRAELADWQNHRWHLSAEPVAAEQVAFSADTLQVPRVLDPGENTPSARLWLPTGGKVFLLRVQTLVPGDRASVLSCEMLNLQRIEVSNSEFLAPPAELILLETPTHKLPEPREIYARHTATIENGREVHLRIAPARAAASGYATDPRWRNVRGVQFQRQSWTWRGLSIDPLPFDLATGPGWHTAIPGGEFDESAALLRWEARACYRLDDEYDGTIVSGELPARYTQDQKVGGSSEPAIYIDHETKRPQATYCRYRATVRSRYWTPLNALEHRAAQPAPPNLLGNHAADNCGEVLPGFRRVAIPFSGGPVTPPVLRSFVPATESVAELRESWLVSRESIADPTGNNVLEWIKQLATDVGSPTLPPRTIAQVVVAETAADPLLRAQLNAVAKEAESAAVKTAAAKKATMDAKSENDKAAAKAATSDALRATGAAEQSAVRFCVLLLNAMLRSNFYDRHKDDICPPADGGELDAALKRRKLYRDTNAREAAWTPTDETRFLRLWLDLLTVQSATGGTDKALLRAAGVSEMVAPLFVILREPMYDLAGLTEGLEARIALAKPSTQARKPRPELSTDPIIDNRRIGALAGLTEGLEARIALAKPSTQARKPRPELSTDPIIDNRCIGAPSGEANFDKPIIHPLIGPIGLTRDPDGVQDAKQSGTIYMIRPIEGKFEADKDPFPAPFEFAKISLRRTTGRLGVDESASESVEAWTTPEYVQFLPAAYYQPGSIKTFVRRLPDESVIVTVRILEKLIGTLPDAHANSMHQAAVFDFPILLSKSIYEAGGVQHEHMPLPGLSRPTSSKLDKDWRTLEYVLRNVPDSQRLELLRITVFVEQKIPSRTPSRTDPPTADRGWAEFFPTRQADTQSPPEIEPETRLLPPLCVNAVPMVQ